MTNETLEKRILVIEDKAMHQKAAKNQLKSQGYVVDVADSLLDAVGLLFGDQNYGYAISKTTQKTKYLAVLTDLNFPGRYGGDPSNSNPAVLGFTAALAAAKQKVPYIGIVTDSDHHEGAVAASLDLLKDDKDKPTIYMLDESKIAIFDIRDMPAIYSYGDSSYDTPALHAKLKEDKKDRTKCEQAGEIVQVKNWSAALEYLMK